MWRLNPLAFRDLVLFAAFALIFLSVPRSLPLEVEKKYLGSFEIKENYLVDSLGNSWRLSSTHLPLGVYWGTLELRPFESSQVPFAFQPLKVFTSKGWSGEAHVLDAKQVATNQVPALLSAWKRAVDQLPWSDTAKAFLNACFLGQARSLPQNLRVGIQRLGLAHLMAVSGFHLGLGWAILGRTSRLFPFTWRKWVAWTHIGVLWYYVSLIGFPVSALRAMAMLTLLALLRMGARRKMGIRGVAFAAGGLLLYQPAWLNDIGFQLSVSAVVGIQIWVTIHRGWLSNLVGVPVVAQWATLWVSLPTFHTWPLAFLPANVLLTPIFLLTYPFALMAIFCNSCGWPIPFPDGLLIAITRTPDSWVWDSGYMDPLMQSLLGISVAMGLWALKNNWKHAVHISVLFAVILMVYSSPTYFQEATWHRKGRGFAQVQVSGDTARIQGTEGFLSNKYYWDIQLNNYFKSRNVKYIIQSVLEYEDTPLEIRKWADTTHSDFLWRGSAVQLD